MEVAVVFCVALCVIDMEVLVLKVSSLMSITLSQVLVVMLFIAYCIVGIAS